ncbi:hypothetical protein Trydic_g7620 [Trypoxylus dichotomus]
MKSIIIAIACFAATVTAADVCVEQCSGNWSGNSSLYFQVNSNVDILYDVDYKIVAVVNTNLNVVVAINAKFVLVLNIQTGGYFLVDIKTNYAVAGKIEIGFISDNSIDYGKLIQQVNALLTQYSSITSSTSGSFSFNLIIVAYAKLEFNWSVILKGRDDVIQIFEESFAAFFQQIQVAIKGGLVVASDIFIFVSIVIEYEYQVAVSIFSAIRVIVIYYQEVSIEFVSALVAHIQAGAVSVTNFSIAIRNYISVQVNAAISTAITWANNVRNQPASINVTLGGTTYALVVSKIDQQYVISFRVASSSSEQVNIRIVFAGNALVLYNLRTNIAVVLYGRYALIVNVNSDIAIVITTKLLRGVVVAIASASSLAADIKYEYYAKITADVKAIINSNLQFVSTWQVLVAAVRSGAAAVANAIGSAHASAVVTYYGEFAIAGSSSSSFGAVVVAVFGNVGWGVSTVLSVSINSIYAVSGSWGGVIKVITGGSFSVSA